MPLRRWRGSLAPQHPAPDIWGVYPTAVLADNPVVYYRLGDASNPPFVKDDSGFAVDIKSSITANFQQVGAFTTDSNTSVLCDGSTTNLFVAKSITTTNGWSVECWIKSPNGGTFPGGNAAWSFGGDGVTQSNRIDLLSNVVQSKVVFSGSLQTLSAGVPLSYNDWHQVVVTWNNSTTNWSIYIDGVQTASTTHAGPVNTASGIEIGNDYLGVDGIFSGYIQDVSFYQSELSAARVLAHYQAGAPFRQVPQGNFSITNDIRFKYLMMNGRRYPARGKVWNSPPVFQAAENTNGYFVRTNHSKWSRWNRQSQKRGHIWGYPWPSATVVQPNFTYQISNAERLRLQSWQRRGKVWSPWWFQAYPPNPVYPINNWGNKNVAQRWTWVRPRKGLKWEPPWPQSFAPNPTITSWFAREAFLQTRLPLLAKRGKVWSPWWYQAYPPNPVWPISRNQYTERVAQRQFQRRGHIWTPVPQQEYAQTYLQDRQTLRAGWRQWLRRGHVWSPHLDQAYPPNPVWPISRDQQLLRVGWRQWQRRGKNWWPTPLTILPNPVITFQNRQSGEEVFLRWWQRRGRNWNGALLGQANPLTNGYWQPPAYHAFMERALRIYQRRGHVWQAYNLGQANPLTNGYWQPNANHATLRAAWRQYQRRGHVWSSSWFFNPAGQVNPNFVNQPSSRGYWVRYYARLQARGTSGVDPVWQFPIAQLGPIDVTRYKLNRTGLWLPRRTLVENVPLPQAFPPNPAFGSNFNVRRGYPRNYPYARRGHNVVPVLQQVIVNPKITDLLVRRAYRRWYEYAKRHRQWQPPIFQAYPPNPPFGNAYHIRGFGKLWWIGPRRGHPFNLPWPQAPLGFVPSNGIYFVDEFSTTLFIADETPFALYVTDDGVFALYLPNEQQGF